MPERGMTREQPFLLPPSLDDWTPAEHPVRFVAALIDGVADVDWHAMGIDPRPDPVGAPRYAPGVLTSVWVWGFMSGIRSARGLERACREQIPVRWLTANQTPDHDTLWRFYQAHRDGMRALLTRSIRVAVAADLVDLALVAVDGTKLRADAAAERSLTTEGLQALLERTARAIAALEAQNTGEASGPPTLPEHVRDRTAVRERVAALEADAVAQRGTGKTNLTDPDATMMNGRQGIAPSYNAQAAVAATSATAQALLGAAAPTGRFVVAATVTAQANDVQELAPLLTEAVAQLGQAPDLTVADAGYHSAAALAQVAEAGYAVVVAEPPRSSGSPDPYGETAFAYDATTDTLTCPAGRVLTFRRIAREEGRADRRLYQGSPAVCRACPAFGTCTRDARHGRVVRRPVDHPAVVAQRAVRASPAAQAALRRRRGLIEGMFGTVKTCLDGRRVHLRGAVAVAAEWTLLATAVNLRTLHRIWCALDAPLRTGLLAAGGAFPATAHP
jgi:transposase